MPEVSTIVVTDRQAAIIRGLASGLTITQLGARFDRSDMTIQRDIQRVRTLIGASTNCQLVDRAWRLGLLTAEYDQLRHERPMPTAYTVRPLRKRARQAKAGRR